MNSKPTRPSADKTRSAILKAATTLFAKSGFCGTSISEIAKAAKINQSLIYHHFGYKEGLWNAIRENISDTYCQQYGSSCNREQTLKEFLTTIVTNKFNFLKKNPNIYRFLHWQRFITDINNKQMAKNQNTKHWLALLEDMQKQGKIRDDYSTEIIAILIANTTHGALNLVGQFVAQTDVEKKEQEYLKLAIEALYAGLKPQS